MPAAEVKIDEQSFRQAEAMLTKLPLELRTAVIPKALKAAAAPAVSKAEQLAPDSHKTGTWDKWSKATLSRRGGAKQHKDTIGVSTVRSYAGGAVLAIYAGPLHPAGNLINVIGHPHAQVLWGRPTGKTIAPNTYLQQAAEQTKAQQQAAFVSSVSGQADKLLQGAKA